MNPSNRQIKICGITNLQDAEIATQLGATHLGFIFAQSPRQISPEKAANIVAVLKTRVQLIGVFVRPIALDIQNVLDLMSLDGLQIHGCSALEFSHLRQVLNFHGRYIQAHEIEADRGPDYSLDADIHLFDSPRMGGTKAALNLEFVKQQRPPGPYWIAGGLNFRNIAEAIQSCNPDGVDVASSVEVLPGLKDPDLMQKLIENVRASHV